QSAAIHASSTSSCLPRTGRSRRQRPSSDGRNTLLIRRKATGKQSRWEGRSATFHQRIPSSPMVLVQEARENGLGDAVRRHWEALDERLAAGVSGLELGRERAAVLAALLSDLFAQALAKA